MQNINNHKILYIVFTILLQVNVFALDIVYTQRTPLIIPADGSIEGLVATPVINAFNKANIKYTLIQRPYKIQFQIIKDNKKETCIIGWFKNSYRESFAKYSKSIYHDRPMTFIANKNFKTDENITLEQLLKTKDLKVLVKEAFSYGEFLDEKFKNVKTTKTLVNHSLMLSMIAKGRADILIISYEEAHELLKNHKYKENLKYINPSDMPKGNKRYIIYSKKVSDETIRKINNFIK